MRTKETKPKKKTVSISSLSELSAAWEEHAAQSEPEEVIKIRETPKNIMELKSASYTVVSLMMYLTGVEKRHFDEHVPELTDVYDKLDQDSAARIIRNLCIVRTAIEKYYMKIATAFRNDFKNLSTLPEYIPSDAAKQLYIDGVRIEKSRPDVNEYLITINQELSNRIGQIKRLFPDWIKWDYIRPLFIMPDGFKLAGIKAAGAYYNADRNNFPYQCYINWPWENGGTIFLNDERFVKALYPKYNDYFENVSLVRGPGGQLLEDLYGFISNHRKVLMVVDCENSDSVKLAAALSSLTPAQRGAIYKVHLFDSDYTTPMWRVLAKTGITNAFNVDRRQVQRIVEHKSQVDMTLAVETVLEVERNGVDAVILVSSDSDYWPLITLMPDTSFLVMVERGKTGQNIKEALEEKGYHYCYIDDFCTAASYTIKTDTLIGELQSQLDELVHFNAQQLLENVIAQSWIKMSDREKDQFYDKYIRHMKLTFSPEGDVRLVIEP